MTAIAKTIKLRSERPVPLLDEPPLGHLQAIIMQHLDQNDDEPCGLAVIEKLSVEHGVWIDPTQIYGTIRKLANQDPPLIENYDTRARPGTPPLKLYRLTAAGRAALKATAAHHTALADYLNDKRKATRS